MTPKSPMDPTHHKKHPKTPTTSTAAATRQRRHPDPITIQNSQAQEPPSRLKLLHRVRSSSKPFNPQQLPPQPRIDTHLKARAMSLSAIANPSKTFIVKSNRLHTTLVAEKQGESNKNDLKQKLKKPSSIVAKEKEEEEEEKKKELNNVAAIDIEKPLGSLGVTGKRRSLGSTKIELEDFLTCNGVKVVSVDMPPFMQIHAVDCARKTRDSLEKFTSKTLALTLKKEFDAVYGPAWHCIVGTSFGSFVTHSVGGFLYFSMDHKLYVLLFKTTVQRAD